MFHPEILSETQKKVIEKLGFLKNCYLAGGTALTIQLGHRTSLDLDFYTWHKFSNQRILQLIRKHIHESQFDSRQPEGTVQGKIMKVHFSLFHYDYPLIRQLLDLPPIKIASLEDIAAMKVVAIVQRAKQRDFIDIYYLIQKLGLENIIKSTYQKYPWYEENNQIIFTSLTYFDEADNDKEINAIKLSDSKLSWKNVKNKLKAEVTNYLSQIKHQ